MDGKECKIPTLIQTTPRTDLTSEDIKKLDDYTSHFYNGDYQIDQAAFKLPCSSNEQAGSLGQFLSMATSNYVATKSDSMSERRNRCAGDLLTWLTHARMMGFIKESISMTTKLNTLEVENKRLKDNQQNLETQVLKLKRENEELHKILDRFGKRTSIVEKS